MKVLVAQFVTESNENIPYKMKLEGYDLRFGKAAADEMQIGTVFEDAGIEVIPSVYANGHAGGIVEKNAFDYIEKRLLNDIREHLNELDGMYLHLHGASEVEGLEGGSGDHHILKQVRAIVGPYMPIIVACDPHGNLSKEYVEGCTVIRSYRQSPHTDLKETVQKCCGFLVELLNRRRNIRPCYRKLPLILGGEQSVSADEPVCTINRYMDEMEKDPRILSASWHVGYIRHDCDVAGCGVVVVPDSEKDQAYAEQKVEELAQFVWERRHEFHYTGLTLEPEEALERALACEGKPVFLTDSGDNTTSGAVGANTWVLRQVMARPEAKSKKFLFGCITDPAVTAQLNALPLGSDAHITLGMGINALSEPVELDVTLQHKGRLLGFLGYQGEYGDCVLVSVKGYEIDIIVAEVSHCVGELHQFEAAGAHCADYDIVVVKQGYIFPELKELGALSIMSLTEGATYQNTAKLKLRRIMRPMFPMDDI